MNHEGIIQFILDPDFNIWWLSLIKIIFLAMGLFYIGFIVFALIKTSWIRRLIFWDLTEILTYRHFGLAGVAKKWAKVKERFDLGTEADTKLAIIEADNLLDGVLKDMGYGGETLGERLDKLTTETLDNLKDVSEIHKIRSNIVHDPSYRLDAAEARKAFEVYEKALNNLQAF
ncbi:MAG: hypothetical protein KJI71_01995 [Patescibacteria group bacterium]|nr:hypothetical protein [Patescibacteria group bacterium]